MDVLVYLCRFIHMDVLVYLCGFLVFSMIAEMSLCVCAEFFVDFISYLRVKYFQFKQVIRMCMPLNSGPRGFWLRADFDFYFLLKTGNPSRCHPLD